jgi:hypothetical protein
MSHVDKIKLKATDLECIKRALEALGLVVEEAEKYKWYGRYMGDSPLLSGYTANDLGKCSYKAYIPGKPEAYEVGIALSKSGEGYDILWDSWLGGHGLVDKIGENGINFVREYAAQVAEKDYRREGYTPLRRWVDDRLEIYAEVY